MMSNTFQRIPGFCPDCGAVLPLLRDKGGISCFTCSRTFLGDLSDVFGNVPVKYTIHFNLRNAKKVETLKKDNEGSIVERKCPQCGNDKMSYATLQLRSADEGQTVFYTCTKCNFKETENS